MLFINLYRVATYPLTAGMMRALVVSIAFAAFMSGCSRVDSPRPGSYRAIVQLAGAEAPFLLDIAQVNNGLIIHAAGGGERVRLDNVLVQDQVLTAQFPEGDLLLRAKLYRDRLEGALIIRDEEGVRELPFDAARAQTHLFYEESATDNADVAGEWRLTTTARKGQQRTSASLVLTQTHDRISGVLQWPSNEAYPLDGQVHGDEVKLVSTAGGTVELYQLEVNERGELEGDFWRGIAGRGEVIAQRSPRGQLLIE